MHEAGDHIPLLQHVTWLTVALYPWSQITSPDALLVVSLASMRPLVMFGTGPQSVKKQIGNQSTSAYIRKQILTRDNYGITREKTLP